jgi:DNA-binding IclR family transcriptional regulator
MSLSSNQSASRVLQVLEVLAASAEPVGVRDIARAIDVSPSIAQRLVSTLAAAGFAEQTESRKYRVGLRAFAVGNAFLSDNALARETLVELKRLADERQLNGYLGVLRGRTVVYLLTCQSSGPIAIKTSVGAETHLHSTALGKALLACLPNEEAKRLLGREPYQRLTPATRLRFAALARDLDKARQAGIATCDEENLVGVYAVGAPVRDATGAAIGAISAALPRHDVGRIGLAELGRLVREAAERISRRLGSVEPLRRVA